MPSAELAKLAERPSGKTQTSKEDFDMSMPTKRVVSVMRLVSLILEREALSTVRRSLKGAKGSAFFTNESHARMGSITLHPPL